MAQIEAQNFGPNYYGPTVISQLLACGHDLGFRRSAKEEKGELIVEAGWKGGGFGSPTKTE